MERKTIVIDGITLYEMDIDEIPNIYYISKDGDIYNCKLKRFISQSSDKDGYLRVHIQTFEGEKKMSVAKLVLLAFKGQPPPTMIDPTVEHKDSNRVHNNIDNLMWLERKLNAANRINTPRGEKNPKNKLTEKEVRDICVLLQEGDMSLREIGNAYNVSKDNIRDIKNRRIWRYISQDYSF